jgi:hypothetical protein
MAATAEVIDLTAFRERRKQPAQPAVVVIAPAVAWVPVWVFAPCWFPAMTGAYFRVDG